VLSTLHTNDAISTAARLIDMGAPSFLVAASLRGILAQRLVRRVCESCSEPHELDQALKGMVHTEMGDKAGDLTFYRGVGCSHCNGTGYAGRIGIFEFLEIDDALVEALQNNDPGAFAVGARAQKGFVPLRRAAIKFASQGITSMDQVLRATYGIEDQ